MRLPIVTGSAVVTCSILEHVTGISPPGPSQLPSFVCPICTPVWFEGGLAGGAHGFEGHHAEAVRALPHPAWLPRSRDWPWRGGGRGTPSGRFECSRRLRVA